MIVKGIHRTVFRPPLKCMDKKINKRYSNSNYVMKYGVMKEDEIKMSKLLLKIDPTQKYFIYPLPVECVLTDKSIDKLKEQKLDIKHNKAYIMKYGGITLTEYMKDSNLHISFELLLKWFVKLAYALKILEYNKIVHYDIKPDNLLILNQDIFIIDFGNSMQVTDDLSSISLYPNYYGVLPLFATIYAINADSIDGMKKFISSRYDRYSKLPDFDMALAVLNSRLRVYGINAYQVYYITRYIFEIDLWCLAYIFMFDILTNIEHIPHLKDLLSKMLLLTPQLQYSIDETVDKIKKYYPQ